MNYPQSLGYALEMYYETKLGGVRREVIMGRPTTLDSFEELKGLYGFPRSKVRIVTTTDTSKVVTISMNQVKVILRKTGMIIGMAKGNQDINANDIWLKLVADARQLLRKHPVAPSAIGAARDVRQHVLSTLCAVHVGRLHL